MTHTPGFEEAIQELIYRRSANGIMPLERLREAAGCPNRIFKAGTMPAYSNYATALAGYIVERVSGMPFDDYLEQNIFAPLGMTHSSFRQPLPTALEAGMSKGYKVASDKPQGLRAHQPRARGLARGERRRHGEVHDRAPAEWRLSATSASSPRKPRRRCMARRSRSFPLNRMVLGFYETEHQRPPRDRARRRHAVVPQRPAPVHRRWRRLLHLGQQRRQGWRCGPLRGGVLPPVRGPLPARARPRRQGRRGDGEGARAEIAGSYINSPAAPNRACSASSTCCSR